jgi:hypothetical protein
MFIEGGWREEGDVDDDALKIWALAMAFAFKIWAMAFTCEHTTHAL